MLRNSRKDQPRNIDHQIIQSSKVFKYRTLRVRDADRIKGTCVYTFTYRSAGNRGQGIEDPNPTIMIVERVQRGTQRFRYIDPTSSGRPSKALGDTYIMGINLNNLSTGFIKYLLSKYGKMSFIPNQDAHNFELFNIYCRIYDTRKIRQFTPLSIDNIMMLLPDDGE